MRPGSEVADRDRGGDGGIDGLHATNRSSMATSSAAQGKGMGDRGLPR